MSEGYNFLRLQKNIHPNHAKWASRFYPYSKGVLKSNSSSICSSSICSLYRLTLLALIHHRLCHPHNNNSHQVNQVLLIVAVVVAAMIPRQSVSWETLQIPTTAISVPAVAVASVFIMKQPLHLLMAIRQSWMIHHLLPSCWLLRHQQVIKSRNSLYRY